MTRQEATDSLDIIEHGLAKSVSGAFFRRFSMIASAATGGANQEKYLEAWSRHSTRRSCSGTRRNTLRRTLGGRLALTRAVRSDVLPRGAALLLNAATARELGIFTHALAKRGATIDDLPELSCMADLTFLRETHRIRPSETTYDCATCGSTRPCPFRVRTLSMT
jgi:hypothetical protein